MNKHWPNRKTKYASKRRRNNNFSKAFKSSVQISEKGGKTMQILVALLRESVLTQGLITFALVVTTCYLWATGQQVPNELWTANTIVIGFFFGAKTQQAATKLTQNRKG